MATVPRNIAVWVLTANGLALANTLEQCWPQLTVHCPLRLLQKCVATPARPFERLADAVAGAFQTYEGHVFVMAAGIVVRTVAPLLHHKAVDPAVVVVDDAGRFAISLVAGHLGGANRLAASVAELLGATAVITTATDSHGRPAVDLVAAERGLKIENPAAIKKINMALLDGVPVPIYDPSGWLADGLGAAARAVEVHTLSSSQRAAPGVYVDDRCKSLPPEVLVVRPPSLVAGIGCNRGTPVAEIEALLRSALKAGCLSINSLAKIATVDLKQDEPGLISLAVALEVPLVFHSRDALNRVRHVPNPSAMAIKHIGVNSVCEAAALLTARGGTLIAPKQKSANATVAIARRPSSSSASVPVR